MTEERRRGTVETGKRFQGRMLPFRLLTLLSLRVITASHSVRLSLCSFLTRSGMEMTRKKKRSEMIRWKVRTRPRILMSNERPQTRRNWGERRAWATHHRPFPFVSLILSQLVPFVSWFTPVHSSRSPLTPLHSGPLALRSWGWVNEVNRRNEPSERHPNGRIRYR